LHNITEISPEHMFLLVCATAIIYLTLNLHAVRQCIYCAHY
jgi:hypothetical protein